MRKLLLVLVVVLTNGCATGALFLKGAGESLKEGSAENNKQTHCLTTYYGGMASTNCQTY